LRIALEPPSAIYLTQDIQRRGYKYLFGVLVQHSDARLVAALRERATRHDVHHVVVRIAGDGQVRLPGRFADADARFSEELARESKHRTTGAKPYRLYLRPPDPRPVGPQPRRHALLALQHRQRLHNAVPGLD